MGGPHRALVAALTLAAAAAGCERGPQAAFDRHAAPVLEASCALTRCHGVSSSEALPEDGFFVVVDDRGRLLDPVAARMRSLARVTTTASFHFSTLVRAPLSSADGGGPHAGGELFASRDAPSARALARWIRQEARGTGGEDIALTELELRFEADVLPLLVRRCGAPTCHGPTDVANTAFPAAADPRTRAFAPVDVRRAYGTVRSFIDLSGADVLGSRLFRKGIGALSGLRHRGSRRTFFPELGGADPSGALERVIDWARAERRALGVSEGRAPVGIVYVRQPVATRAPYRIEPEETGSELMFLRWPPGSAPAEDLGAALHPEGPVEIREPAVSHDGRTIAFAMRRDAEAAFAIYEIDVRTRDVTRISPSSSGSFVSPVYGPDGRLVAAWDGHGEAGADGPGVPPELVALDRDGAFERLTWSRAPSMRPGVLASGRTRGMIVLGTRRTGSRGEEGVLFRFPLCHDPALHGEAEYHVHFGASLAPSAPLVARDLLDGRQIMIVLPSASALDDRGALVLLDRSLGPRLPDGDLPSFGGLLDPVSTLDAAPRWRDPAPLPDGRVLASTDVGRPDGEDALVAITIVDGADGASLGDVETLVAEVGFAIRSAAVVISRPIEDDDHLRVTDPAGATARISIRDATILEALYGRAEPTGVRPLRTDLAAVRLLVPARTDGLLGVGARVLAEVPLAADHSAELEIAARTPVTLQWIDARGMVVGSQLDRWFFGDGGEVLPLGTNPTTYGHACASCHGTLSGSAAEPRRPAPDILSAASVTLSTHALRDRRQPLAPVSVEGLAPVDVSFEAVIAPILDARCVFCHGGPEPAGQVSLEPGPGDRFPRAYEALVAGGRVGSSHRARLSPLVERLLGSELDAPGTPSSRCPPEGLSDGELRDVLRWIEAGASYREVE